MILVRDIFSLKFGKAKDVKALMQESKKLMDEPMIKRTRILFDLVGPAYTMVLEGTYENLADFEKVFSTGPGKRTGNHGIRNLFLSSKNRTEKSGRFRNGDTEVWK
jgi:hypothetical protein